MMWVVQASGIQQPAAPEIVEVANAFEDPPADKDVLSSGV